MFQNYTELSNARVLCGATLCKLLASILPREKLVLVRKNVVYKIETLIWGFPIPGFAFDAFPKHVYAPMLSPLLEAFKQQKRALHDYRGGYTSTMLHHDAHLLSETPNTIIYLSRSNGTKPRIMVNEDVFTETTRRVSVLMGYRFVVFEEPAKYLLEDVQLFQSARVVVGIHGGALANIVWCQKNTHIVEINKDENSDRFRQQSLLIQILSSSFDWMLLSSLTSPTIFSRRDVFLLTEDKPRHMYASMAYSLGLHYHVYVPQHFPASYNNETYPPVLVEISHFKEFFLRLLQEVV
jgi:hypothetical protein